MNTPLKVVLLLIAALIALKLLPLTFAIGCGLALSLVLVAVLGLSAIAVLLSVALGLVALLAPIWLPMLAIVGLVALVKRSNRTAA